MTTTEQGHKASARLLRALLLTVSTIAVVAAAVGLAIWKPQAVARNHFNRSVRVADWRKYTGGRQRIGPDTAPVVIIEFSDPACAKCRRLSKIIRAVQAKHATNIAVVYHYFPLTKHSLETADLALASECAAAQNRFAPFYDLLFGDPAPVRERNWTLLADQANIPDTLLFSKCIQDASYAERVKADIDAGRTLNLKMSPMVLVNAGRLGSIPTRQALERIVRRTLASTRAKSDSLTK